MKPTIRDLLGLLLGGAAGYLLAVPSARPSATSANQISTAVDKPFLVPQPGWKTQLPTVRQAPASRSETAWVKWAFAIPDQDIPNAIKSLNPRADFHALRVLFSRWVQLDGPDAWKAFEALPIPNLSTSWYGDAGRPQLHLGGGSLISNPRALIAGRMLYSASRVDPESSMVQAEKLLAEMRAVKGGNPAGGDFYITQFIKDKSAEPPGAQQSLSEEKISNLISQPDSDEKEAALSDALNNWAGRNPTTAARWWLGLSEEERRRVNPNLLSDSITKNVDPPLKTEFMVEGLRAKAVSGDDLTNFYRIKNGPDHFGTTAENNQLKQSAAALAQWAGKDPAAAHAWLAAQPDDALKTFLTGELAGSLTRTSPAGAVALLADLPAEYLPLAVSGLTSGWMQQDAAACAAWVAKIEDPAVRDSCQQNMARSIMASDPALALRLSLQITDDQVRKEIQNQITQGLSWNPAGLEKIIAADPAVQASLARKPVAN